ncbi:hypothetical protein OG738_21820 [Amycolatopsis sp. NBC_01488]|uniref:hypothetical protein n=1 Tax=Amycolatopsis sp. NBC_01488 TaxID=2903563 RepID=UPI002E2A8859|nr:hypothetical protein [Amycolatopsis sp. NBC_01488]
MLLSVLAFALIGMHSLVTAHTADVSHGGSRMVATSAEAAFTPAETVAGPSVEQATAGTDTECCPDHDQAMNHSGPASHGHDLLHLCLAVLVALAGLEFGWLLWQRRQTHTLTATRTAP